MLNANSKAKTLGDYLKSRRNRFQPEQAGFKASNSQRRTQGLEGKRSLCWQVSVQLILPGWSRAEK